MEGKKGNKNGKSSNNQTATPQPDIYWSARLFFFWTSFQMRFKHIRLG